MFTVIGGARLAIVVVILLAAVAPAGLAEAPGPQLTAASSEPGWIALTLTGVPDVPVEIRERDEVVARMTVSAGAATLARAVAWRCDRRRRSLEATVVASDGTAQRVATAITTPSCIHRLELIVAPGRLRPGQFANVHVADTWRRGGVAGRVCGRSGGAHAQCRNVRLRSGQVRLRTRLRLPRAGSWTVTLRSAETKAAAQRRVEVGPRERYRMLVTGDSMVYGVIDVLERSVRKTGGVLTGDPNPATGITKPSLLNWPDHARASVRSALPDATVVFLGAAVDTFALTLASGETVACCGPQWVAEYSRQVHEMMATYLRRGRGVVYWILLPAPRDPRRVESIHAINAAIQRAAADFPDGIEIVDIRPAISPGDRYRDTATYHGRRRAIRESDGIHLANAGVHLACEVILRDMRRDGLVR
ncbi:MAG TPA: hypothetical protein VMY78_17840 [Solirubrobacteraceae bacterium]|nr:hypothetical protein [Solirubrobacteraceae bacterium]